MNKKYSKLISFLLILIITVSFVGTGTYAYPDVSTVDFADSAIMDLFNLGFLQDDPIEAFRPDAPVTRAEFAQWLSSVGNVDMNGAALAGNFSDVPEDHPNIDAIMTLVGYGVMNGCGNGKFEPDRTLEAEELIKSVMTLLGYKAYAEAEGGYPVGYFKMASEKGITEGITFGGTPVSRRDAIRILFKALSVEVLTVKAVTESNMIYSADEGNDLLYHAHKLRKDYGRVTDTEFSNLRDGSAGASGMLTISGTLYYDRTENGRDMLGRMVEFYYDDSYSGIKSIVYIKPDSKSVTYKIDGEDILSFENNILEYTDGNRKISLRVSPTADVIFNGKVSDYSKEDITFKEVDGKKPYGTLYLMDNTGNGICDVVDIRAWRNLIVNSVHEAVDKDGELISNQFSVYDMNGEVVTISAQDTYYMQTVDGQDFSYKGLEKEDVLSVAASKDGSLVKFIYCDEVITGTVEEITDEGSGKYIVKIDETEYKVCQAYGYYCIDQTAMSIGLAPGDKAFFILDWMGHIAEVKTKSINTGYTFGLFIDYKIANGLGNTVDVKVLQEDGNIAVKQLSSKVNIDGKTYSSDKVINLLTQVAIEYNGINLEEEPSRKEILVKYALDNDGVIKLIDTPYMNAPGEDEDVQSLHVMPPTVNKSKEYLKNMNEFGGKIVGNSDTVFFYLPPDDGTITDESYGVFSTGMLKNDQQHEFRAFASNLNAHVAEAMVIYGPKYAKNEVRIDKGTPASIFLKKSIGLDAEGIPRIKIHYSQVGRDMSICVNPKDADTVKNLETLSSGDAFRYGVDKDGNADRIDILYKFDMNKLIRDGKPYADERNDLTHRNGNHKFRDDGSNPIDWMNSTSTRVSFGAVYGIDKTVISYLNQSEFVDMIDGRLHLCIIEDPIRVNLANLTQAELDSIERRVIDSWQLCRYDAISNTVVEIKAKDVRAYQQSPGEHDYVLALSRDNRPFMMVFYNSSDINWE